MGRLRVLNAESLDFSEEARAALREFADLQEMQLDRAGLLAQVVGFDAVIVRLGNRIDGEVLAAGSALKVVSSATTGLDHIDLEAAQRAQVDVLSLKGEQEFLQSVTATAELAWALLLALVRRVPAGVADVGQGNWQRDRFRGIELAGRTLGIIGYGRLGRMVARYGIAFGMNVLVTDVVRASAMPEGMTFTDLSALLAASDVVSLHVPLDDATRGLIGGAALARMKPGALLVNTSRGEIVERDALLAALVSGRLGGAALDVVDDERPGAGTMKGHPLIEYAAEHENLIITPHIGGATWDSMRKTEVFMAHKLRRWARDKGFAGA